MQSGRVSGSLSIAAVKKVNFWERRNSPGYCLTQTLRHRQSLQKSPGHVLGPRRIHLFHLVSCEPFNRSSWKDDTSSPLLVWAKWKGLIVSRSRSATSALAASRLAT